MMSVLASTVPARATHRTSEYAGAHAGPPAEAPAGTRL